MPSRLKRDQTEGHDRFITFSCYEQQPLLNSDHARITFEKALEALRKRNIFYVYAYVIMPEHVHLLVSEPKLHPLATTLGVLKKETARLLKGDREHFWKTRYFDFNVLTHVKHTEKLNYIHMNPVRAVSLTNPKIGSGAAPVTTPLANAAASRSNPNGHGTCANGMPPHPCRR